MNHNFKDLSGERFGRLMAMHVFGRTKGGKAIWLCKCVCGKTKGVNSDKLICGETQSCGCLRPDVLKGNRYRETHGGSSSVEFKTWCSLKKRCLCITHRQFKDYGGRGITVCDRWRYSFENFLKDMGPRPPGRTIDRINNDGNYEPGNCRWATYSQQNSNKRHPVGIKRGPYKKRSCPKI